MKLRIPVSSRFPHLMSDKLLDMVYDPKLSSTFHEKVPSCAS